MNSFKMSIVMQFIANGDAEEQCPRVHANCLILL